MSSVHRRGFLQASALTILTASSAKAAPSERVNVAVMGVRGRGRGLAEGFARLKDAQVVYLCDVDASTLPKLRKQVTDLQEGREPKTASDVSKVLDDPSVDALVIATPDHWHALATIWACRAGKHVYVEKPASHNLAEGRKMVEAARKYDRVVQLGTQSRSAPHYMQMVEFLRAGKLGKVHMAKVWNSQKRDNIGHKPDSTVPAGVDYSLWLGPAPERPFNVNRFHYTWHWNWDYGTGDIGNDGVHDLDIARWGLGVVAPETVACAGGKLEYDDDQQTPDTQVVTYSFPDSKAVLVYEQRLWSPYVQEGYENGVAFYGTEGYILAGRAGWKLFRSKNKEEAVPQVGRFSDEPHKVNFLECIKTRKRPNADIEEGHRSSSLSHLGNIAYRVGRPVKFDGKNETISGDTEASQLLRRTYRTGFEVPEQV